MRLSTREVSPIAMMQSDRPAMDLTAYFQACFVDSLAPEETAIGIESEFPLIDLKTGRAVSPAVTHDIFQEFIKFGWTPVFDQGTGALVSVAKKYNDFNVEFGSDVGRSIIEISYPPVRNLWQILDYEKQILEPIKASVAKRGAALLGYGILPLEKPHRSLIAEKGRYRFFEKDSSNTFVTPEDGVDLHVFALTASAQTHIQVTKAKAIRLLNVMNSLSGLFILLGANAPVWGGARDAEQCRAVRERLWEVGWPTRANQVAILRPMSSFDDYVNTILSFRPQMLKRNEYLCVRQAGFSNQELFEKRFVIAENVKGEKIPIEMKVEDIVFMGSFAWYNARLSRYGTVESRVICQQPPKEAHAMSALVLGLAIALDETEALVNKKAPTGWRQFRLSAMYNGFHDMSGIELAEKALDIAAQGLKRRGFGEEIFLESVQARLQQRQAPTEKILQAFEEKGIDELIARSII